MLPALADGRPSAAVAEKVRHNASAGKNFISVRTTVSALSERNTGFKRVWAEKSSVGHPAH